MIGVVVNPTAIVGMAFCRLSMARDIIRLHYVVMPGLLLFASCGCCHG